MCLSTVTLQGRSASRYMELLRFDDYDGSFMWMTNENSRKAQELENNPYASLTFWWAELHRAVRVEGKVEKTS